MKITHDAFNQQVAEFTDPDEFNAHVDAAHPTWKEPQVARRIDVRSKRIMASRLYKPELKRWV